VAVGAAESVGGELGEPRAEAEGGQVSQPGELGAADGSAVHVGRGLAAVLRVRRVVAFSGRAPAGRGGGAGVALTMAGEWSVDGGRVPRLFASLRPLWAALRGGERQAGAEGAVPGWAERLGRA
jgi:hypothetical protein